MNHRNSSTPVPLYQSSNAGNIHRHQASLLALYWLDSQNLKQRSCEKVMFSQVSVSYSVHGVCVCGGGYLCTRSLKGWTCPGVRYLPLHGGYVQGWVLTSQGCISRRVAYSPPLDIWDLEYYRQAGCTHLLESCLASTGVVIRSTQDIFKNETKP